MTVSDKTTLQPRVFRRFQMVLVWRLRTVEGCCVADDRQFCGTSPGDEKACEVLRKIKSRTRAGGFIHPPVRSHDTGEAQSKSTIETQNT